MLKSLYSGISGMLANQTKLDVIGNNIANVGTTAFKANRAKFQDLLSQNVSAAMSPMANQGGINPSQVGIGVKIASIDTIAKQGNMQSTSRSLDVAIDGEGYFMVAQGPEISSDTEITVDNAASKHTITKKPSNVEIMYTRDGSFTLDEDGNLLTSDGFRVLGYAVAGSIDTGTGNIKYVDATASGLVASDTSLKTLKIPDTVTHDTDGELKVTSFSISKDGTLNAVLEDGRVTVLGQIAMASFKNPEGLNKLGKNLCSASVNSGDATIKTGLNTAGGENSEGYGDMLQGMLEMSNVDLAEQFTDMIVATRSFQASGKMITTSDEILQDIINLKR